MNDKENKQTESAIQLGYTLDYISGKQVKETKKELVRQRVVRPHPARKPGDRRFIPTPVGNGPQVSR